MQDTCQNEKEITTKKEKPNMLGDVDYNTIPGCF